MEELKKEFHNLDKRLVELNATLIRNTEILNEHHKRTTLNEQRIEFIEKHVLMINSVFKFLTILLALLVALNQLGVLPPFNFFKVQ